MVERLKKLYRQMSDMTRPKCGSCNIPLQCCSPEYCDMTIRWAREKYGEELKTTSHPRLPLMGANGCTAEPHLRPLCTVHVCEKQLMIDPKFHDAYFELREQIDELEYELHSGG